MPVPPINPGEILVTFQFTVPTYIFNPTARYDLYIDGDTKPKASVNNPVDPIFTLALSLGSHTYEIKAVNRTLVKGKDTQLTSSAAAGSFIVDPDNSEFIVGTTNDPPIDNLIQAVLSTADYINGIANYAITLIASASATWIIDTFSTGGAASASVNYDNGSYKRFTVTGNSFSDTYPIGSQIHLEARGNGGQLNVIDFIAGTPPAPSPTSVSITSGPPNLNSVYFTTAGATGTPTTPEGTPTVGFVTGGNYSPGLSNLYFLFDYGDTNTLVTLPADNTGGPFNFTTGPILDFFQGQTPNAYIPYLILDPTQNIIIGNASVQFSTF